MEQASPNADAGAVTARPVSALIVANVLACAGLVALVLPQRVGLGTDAIRLGFFALGLAAAAIIAAFARRPVAGASSALRGLAIAAGTISAAFFLGLSGAVFTWGQDGLAFGLGLGAGYLLLQLLVGPSFVATGAASVPEFFAARFGAAARTLACCVIAISMLVLLVAQVSAAALVSARLLEVDFGVGVAVAAVALGGCFLLKGRTGPSLITAALFPLMLVAFLAPAVQLSLPWSGMPMPQIAHAQALWQIQGLEETLLDQDLADAAFMKPMLAPFISLSATNVMGVILGLAAGMACLPPALALLRGASAREARWSLVWALALAALFLTAAPALAAYAKYALLSLIGNHTQIAQLPAWMFTYGKLGLLDICGYPAVDAATTVAACATLPDPTAVLRLQDVTLQPDMIALAAPEMAGLAPAMLGLLAAAALAAALVTADGPLAAVIEALRGLRRRGSETTGSGKSGYALAVAVVLVAALAAAARPCEPAHARNLGALRWPGPDYCPRSSQACGGDAPTALARRPRSSPGLRSAPSIFSAHAISPSASLKPSSRSPVRVRPRAIPSRSCSRRGRRCRSAQRRMQPGRRSMRTRRRWPTGGASSRWRRRCSRCRSGSSR